MWRGPASGEIVLSNGLLARTFRLTPNAATVGLDQLTTGEALLRGVKPEAVLEISGQRCEVGGLVGQPNYAFLRERWLDNLTASPTAFQFVRFEVGKPTERFAWNRVRHCAPQTTWPPTGVSLRLDFIGPAGPVTAERRGTHRCLAASRHLRALRDVRRNPLLLQMDFLDQRYRTRLSRSIAARAKSWRLWSVCRK